VQFPSANLAAEYPGHAPIVLWDVHRKPWRHVTQSIWVRLLKKRYGDYPSSGLFRRKLLTFFTRCAPGCGNSWLTRGGGPLHQGQYGRRTILISGRLGSAKAKIRPKWNGRRLRFYLDDEDAFKKFKNAATLELANTEFQSVSDDDIEESDQAAE
jgi:hypothetical protein